jgi:D-arabinose 1-dehydrogenase-like Zn-dependent alcohol dehydrogenase
VSTISCPDVALDQVPAVVNRMFEGKVQGRVVVDVNA